VQTLCAFSANGHHSAVSARHELQVGDVERKTVAPRRIASQ
jgi:hypothetical protein